MRYLLYLFIPFVLISFTEDGYAKTENSYNNYTLIVMLVINYWIKIYTLKTKKNVNILLTE